MSQFDLHTLKDFKEKQNKRRVSGWKGHSGVGDVTQMVECLPNTYEVLGSSPALHTLNLVAHVCPQGGVEEDGSIMSAEFVLYMFCNYLAQILQIK